MAEFGAAETHMLSGRLEMLGQDIFLICLLMLQGQIPHVTGVCPSVESCHSAQC